MHWLLMPGPVPVPEKGGRPACSSQQFERAIVAGLVTARAAKATLQRGMQLQQKQHLQERRQRAQGRCCCLPGRQPRPAAWLPRLPVRFQRSVHGSRIQARMPLRRGCCNVGPAR